jgi:hypothetical protein
LFITSSYSSRCLRDSKFCAFDGLLRALDALGDHLRLDGHAFFHAQPLQQRAHPLLGEDAHQVVFEREIEARLAGIALAAGAARSWLSMRRDSCRSVPRMNRPPASITCS